jgi:hypothetical protein
VLKRGEELHTTSIPWASRNGVSCEPQETKSNFNSRRRLNNIASRFGYCCLADRLKEARRAFRCGAHSNVARLATRDDGDNVSGTPFLQFAFAGHAGSDAAPKFSNTIWTWYKDKNDGPGCRKATVEEEFAKLWSFKWCTKVRGIQRSSSMAMHRNQAATSRRESRQKMVLYLKIPPGSVVSERDARPFQSVFLRST